MFKIAIALVAACLMSAAVQAGQLAKPAGKVILTVSGSITNFNGNGVAEFDLAMLDALPQRTTLTVTPWYVGEQSFSGPVMADLLAVVGGNGDTVKVTALNEYSAMIPVTDLVDSPVILATRRNGDEMAVRDKGPLFVIYPFDLDPALYNEVYFGRSVWQVQTLMVE